MDEYSSAHLKTTALNQICDGTYQYPTKGGNSLILPMTVLICGNKHPRDIYSNTYQFIESRFNVISVEVIYP